MIVGIVGSRRYQNLPAVSRFVIALAAKHPSVIIVSGGASGVDSAAESAAYELALPVISYRPEEFDAMEEYGGGVQWTIRTVADHHRAQDVVVAKHRRINPPTFKTFAQAAIFRNGWIVDDAERLVAFWDGVSTGTKNTIERARKAGKEVYVR